MTLHPGTHPSPRRRQHSEEGISSLSFWVWRSLQTAAPAAQGQGQPSWSRVPALPVLFGAVPLCHRPAVPREHWDHSFSGNYAGGRTWPAVRRSGQRSFPPIRHTGIKRSTEYFPENSETHSSWNSLWCLGILVKNEYKLIPLPFLVWFSTDINSDDGSLGLPLVSSEHYSFSSHMSTCPGLTFHGTRHKLSLLGTPGECERTGKQRGTRSDLVESWEPAVAWYEMSLFC